MPPSADRLSGAALKNLLTRTSCCRLLRVSPASLDGPCRRDRQDDLGSDLPILLDLDQVDDHQKWFWRPVLSCIGHRNIHWGVGFGYITRQSDDLEPRKVGREDDRSRCSYIVQFSVDRVIAPKPCPVAFGWNGVLGSSGLRHEVCSRVPRFSLRIRVARS